MTCIGGISTLLIAGGNNEAEKLREITTINQTSERAEKLEAFAASASSLDVKLDALLLAAKSHKILESTEDNMKAQLDLKEVIRKSPGTWREIVAMTSLIGTLHQDGKHDEVIVLSEKLLQRAPGQILNNTQAEVPLLIKEQLMNSTIAVEDEIRSVLAIAYKETGRDMEALLAYGNIKDEKFRRLLANTFDRSESKAKPNGQTSIQSAPSTTLAKENDMLPAAPQPKSVTQTNKTELANTTQQVTEQLGRNHWLIWLLVIFAALSGVWWLMRKPK